MSGLPVIKDVDSERAHLYESVKQAGKADLLNTPQSLINAIRQGAARKA